MGHGDAEVRLTVLKRGPSAPAEGRYAVHLSELSSGLVVGPVEEFSDGFVMDWHPPTLWGSRDTLLATRRALSDRLWPHYAVHGHGQSVESHSDAFRQRFSFALPAWARESVAAIHGDPTLANVRRAHDADELRLIDPKPPGHGIPSVPGVDRGKVLQSFIGWESALCDLEPVDHVWPLEDDLSQEDLRRAVFWLGVHLLRITQREQPTGRLLPWAQEAARRAMEIVW